MSARVFAGRREQPKIRQARAAEDRKAIEHLQALSDAQLRDMGITRMDISHVVRFGKQEG